MRGELAAAEELLRPRAAESAEAAAILVAVLAEQGRTTDAGALATARQRARSFRAWMALDLMHRCFKVSLLGDAS